METEALMNVPNAIVGPKPFANTQLLMQKHSPEILLGVGITGMLVSTVLACRATLKAPAAIAVAQAKFNDIAEATETLNEEDYSKTDRRQDLVKASVQTAWDFTKLYGVPVALMGLSIYTVVKGHGITMKRNAGLTAALTMVSAGYKEYRKRVAERYGEDTESDIYLNRKSETVEVEDAKGKKSKKKVSTIEVPLSASPYSIMFDESCTEWQGSPEINIARLRSLQNYCNDKLRMNNVLFLNEVFDMLGAPRTKAGQVVGWAVKSDGDGFVDFGIQRVLDFYEKNGDFYDRGDRPSSRIPLDFNVDGNVWDLI